MSSFISAMDSINQYKTIGVNGSDVYSVPIGKEQELLALFGALNRNLEKDRLIALLDNALLTSSSLAEGGEFCQKQNLTSNFVDLVVLAFHTRDVREGKGERDLFYHMFNYLYTKNPDKLIQCLELISFYGCWVDFQKLLDFLEEGELKQRIKRAIIQIYIKQLVKDSENTNDYELSLAAKWAPREGKQWDYLAKEIASSLYALASARLDLHPRGLKSLRDGKDKPLRTALKQYRKLIVGLNKRLGTTEIKMCHDLVINNDINYVDLNSTEYPLERKHNFSGIEPSKVPSKCLKIKRKAFYFENKLSKKSEISEEDKQDRLKCKENFEEHMAKAVRGDAKVHGKLLMPHEFSMLISNNSSSLSENEKMTIESQWIDLRNSILDKGSLGKVVIMSDFSGSMCSGRGKVRPIDVAKGLGILCAECATPAFKNRIMTFDSTPNWIDISHYSNLFEKVLELDNAPWGGSTNFSAGIEMILESLVKFNVPLGEEPDILLCITDMGWDCANGRYGSKAFETHIDRIKRRFNETGGWKVPSIVVWNVSGDFQEYHHESETEGVCMISGWSPNILKYLLNGENIVEKIKELTPHKFMRDVLDDTRYDKVRAIFS